MKLSLSKDLIRSITLFFSILQIGSFLLPATGRAVVILDGTMGPAGALTGPDYQITATSGTLNNTNLFHSFGKFNIGTGETATFSGPFAVQNIIARVTGGNLSGIDGLVRSDIMSANLYLLNPSGFLFGPNAQLDVTGSFHVSTSDYITLGKNGVFYADPSQTSSLTVDPPAGFGFLGSNPGSVVINGSRLEVHENKTISLIGGDIQVTGNTANDAMILAPGGRVDMASVLSPGEIVPDGAAGTPDLAAKGVDTFGNIDLKYARVDAGGNGGGTVFICGGKLTAGNGIIYASNRGASASLPGNGIDINLSGDLILDESNGWGSIIGANILPGVMGKSGGVRIQADRVEINSSRLSSVAMAGSNGQSGDIELSCNSLQLENGGAVQAGTLGSGKGGDIMINSGDLKVWNGSYIFTNATGGTGDSGDIHVTADQVLMGNDSLTGSFCWITSQTQGSATGKSGDIVMNINDLQMLPSTEISSATFSFGQAGRIDLNARGSIDIQGTRELQQNGNAVYTGIFGNTWWEAGGGNIEISAKSLNLYTKAFIQVSAYSTGDAGNTILNVGSLDISDGSGIHSTCFWGTGGDGGLVDITADSLVISGAETSIDPFGDDATGIITASGSGGGAGGDIDLKIRDIIMISRASIDSNSYGPGSGGNINISADNVQVLSGSQINAGGYGSGDGGSVALDALYMKVAGGHPGSFHNRYLDKTMLAASTISSEAGNNGGNGGKINLSVGKLEVLDGASLSTVTTGVGNSGNINIVSGSLVVSGVNEVMKGFLNKSTDNPQNAASHVSAGTNSYFNPDTGNGGEINIQTSGLLMENNGWISSHTTSTGKGGDITISSQRADLTSGARISAGSRTSGNAGDAGNITISTAGQFNMDNASLLTSSEKAAGGDINAQANSIALTNNTLISAQSSGAGDAGSVYLSGQDSFLMRESKITTDAKRADGGNIKVRADRLVYLIDSEISASVGGGAGTSGGNISIDPEFVILKNSRISANAFEGQGGNIDIVSDVFLADPDSSMDASSTLGIDGRVEIRSPVTYLNSLVSPLSKDFRSAVALLRTPCMARVQKGKYSSLMIKGRDSLPVEPGRFLSSPLSMK